MLRFYDYFFYSSYSLLSSFEALSGFDLVGRISSTIGVLITINIWTVILFADIVIPGFDLLIYAQSVGSVVVQVQGLGILILSMLLSNSYFKKNERYQVIINKYDKNPKLNSLIKFFILLYIPLTFVLFTVCSNLSM